MNINSGIALPSRELTYPTLGKGKSSTQKCRLVGEMLVPRQVSVLMDFTSTVLFTSKQVPGSRSQSSSSSMANKPNSYPHDRSMGRLLCLPTILLEESTIHVGKKYQSYGSHEYRFNGGDPIINKGILEVEITYHGLTIAEVIEVNLALTPPMFCNNDIYIMFFGFND